MEFIIWLKHYVDKLLKRGQINFMCKFEVYWEKKILIYVIMLRRDQVVLYI